MIKRTIIIISCVLLAVGIVSGRAGQIDYGGIAARPSVRDLGSGEAFIVVPETDNLMYNNPAGLNFDGFRINIPELNFIIDNDFLSAGQYIFNHKDDFGLLEDPYANTPEENTKVQELIDDTAPFDGRWIQLGMTPNINVSYKNIGVGMYAIMDPQIIIDQGTPVPKVFAEANLDFVLSGAISKRIYKQIAGGVNVRYIERRTTGLIHLSPLQLAEMENPSDLINEIVDKATIPVRLITVSPGLLMPIFNNKLKFGGVLQDMLVLRLKDDEKQADWKPNAKGAISYQVPLKDATYFIRHIKVGAGLDDMLNTKGTHLFTRTHIGAEMKVLAAFGRLGLNGGLPSIGLGVDLWAVRADYVFFGKERGLFPWQDPSWNHMISLRLGW